MKSIYWLGLGVGMMMLTGCGQSHVSVGSSAQVEARITPVGEVAMVPAPIPAVSKSSPSAVTAAPAAGDPHAQAPSPATPAHP